MKYKVIKVSYGTDAYKETLEMRDLILRKPLGLIFTEAQLATEKEQIHIACYDEAENLVGCLVLVKGAEGKRIKMRQVAVAQAKQRKGIGQQMVLFAEKYGQKNGFEIMYCHARKTAVPFYEKLNYYTVGDEFEEVTIPHYKMEKVLL